MISAPSTIKKPEKSMDDPWIVFVKISNTNKIKISKTIVHSTEFNELNVKSLSRMDRVIALFKALHEPSLVRKTSPPSVFIEKTSSRPMSGIEIEIRIVHMHTSFLHSSSENNSRRFLSILRENSPKEADRKSLPSNKNNPPTNDPPL